MTTMEFVFEKVFFISSELLMLMIMWADRQDSDDVPGHTYLKFNFIGETFLCKQKTSQNKQIHVCPTNSKHYATSRSTLCQGQSSYFSQLFEHIKIKIIRLKFVVIGFRTPVKSSKSSLSTHIITILVSTEQVCDLHIE